MFQSGSCNGSPGTGQQLRDNAIKDICHEFERLRGIQNQIVDLEAEKQALHGELCALRNSIADTQRDNADRVQLADENAKLRQELVHLASSSQEREVCTMVPQPSSLAVCPSFAG